MKKQEIKIIKKAIPLFLVTMIIISTAFQAIGTNYNEFKDMYDRKDVVPPQFFIIAFGACKKILLNGEENAWYSLEGNLIIFNEHVFGTNENYHILIYDSFKGKIYTKHTLPNEFSLYGFSGWGKIEWIPFPHSPCTYFWLFGNADYMKPDL